MDDEQNLIHIDGRKEGFISWLLTRIGISPNLSLKVSAETIRLSEGSLAGAKHRVLPIDNVCSTFYGYHKPWREALMIAATLVALAIFFCEAQKTNGAVAAVMVLLALAVAILYYVLNKTLTIAFVENSGVINAVAFKRSVIEGQNIDEASAKYVSDLTQALIDNKKTSRRAPNQA